MHLILYFSLFILFFGNYWTFKVPKIKEEIIVSLHHVHDGDTITVIRQNGTKFKVRLAFIDAPELLQDFGNESKLKLISILKNIPYFKISEYHDDPNGRVLGQVTTLDGLDINRVMVKSGFAWCYRRRCPTQYKKEQKLAKKNKIGLWIKENPTSPYNYRKSAQKSRKKRKRRQPQNVL